MWSWTMRWTSALLRMASGSGTRGARRRPTDGGPAVRGGGGGVPRQAPRRVSPPGDDCWQAEGFGWLATDRNSHWVCCRQRPWPSGPDRGKDRPSLAPEVRVWNCSRGEGGVSPVRGCPYRHHPHHPIPRSTPWLARRIAPRGRTAAISSASRGRMIWSASSRLPEWMCSATGVRRCNGLQPQGYPYPATP